MKIDNTVNVKYTLGVGRCDMDEKRIEEIVKDPNTWEWDGCTYPEDDRDPYGEKWRKEMDDYFAQFK